LTTKENKNKSMHNHNQALMALDNLVLQGKLAKLTHEWEETLEPGEDIQSNAIKMGFQVLVILTFVSGPNGWEHRRLALDTIKKYRDKKGN